MPSGGTLYDGGWCLYILVVVPYVMGSGTYVLEAGTLCYGGWYLILVGYTLHYNMVPLLTLFLIFSLNSNNVTPSFPLE